MDIHISTYLTDKHTGRHVYCVIGFLLTSVTNSLGVQRRFPPQSVEIRIFSMKKKNSGKNSKISQHGL